jgi:hypothetical protein
MATDGDAWSGFRSNASLMPSASDSAAPTAGAGSQLAIGAALLGVGLLGLCGGVAAAQTLRRRAVARR